VLQAPLPHLHMRLQPGSQDPAQYRCGSLQAACVQPGHAESWCLPPTLPHAVPAALIPSARCCRPLCTYEKQKDTQSVCCIQRSGSTTNLNARVEAGSKALPQKLYSPTPNKSSTPLANCCGGRQQHSKSSQTTTRRNAGKTKTQR
jgi:hypothetical protein